MCADHKKERIISSMTGYGRAVVSKINQRYVAEIRSVNNRYAEIRIHGLREDFFLEFELNKLIKQTFHRGKFDLVLRKEMSVSDSSGLNEKKIEKHLAQLRKLQKNLGLQSEISLETILATMPSSSLDAKDDKSDHVGFLSATTEALEALNNSRQNEGKILLKDMNERSKMILDFFTTIQKKLPEIQAKRKDEVQTKIRAALHDIPADHKRVETEIALLIDKMDVTEEIVRFTKHWDSFDQLLNHPRYNKLSVGRELDFTMQEMNREINTIGSKIGNVDLSKMVVNIKSEMEKIREQVQNIE